jgi:hypothetical protein
MRVSLDHMEQPGAALHRLARVAVAPTPATLRAAPVAVRFRTASVLIEQRRHPPAVLGGDQVKRATVTAVLALIVATGLLLWPSAAAASG